MQRKRTKQSRGRNEAERRFQDYTSQSCCIGCGSDGGVICDHLWGSAKKTYVGLERVNIGHWAVIPLCVTCDDVKTRGSRRMFEQTIGDSKALWALHASGYNGDIPDNVKEGIASA